MSKTKTNILRPHFFNQKNEAVRNSASHPDVEINLGDFLPRPQQGPTCVAKLLQMVRLVFNQPKKAHVTPLLMELHWRPVSARIKFESLTLCLPSDCCVCSRLLKYCGQGVCYITSAAFVKRASPSSATCTSRTIQTFSICSFP